jgi:hypothetical protein
VLGVLEGGHLGHRDHCPLGYGDRLSGVSLDPPLHEVFAFIRRRNSRPSPATRALVTLAEQHFARLSDP